MGAEARAAAEHRDEESRKVAMLSEAALLFIDTEADRLGIDLTRLALVFDVGTGRGKHALASVFAGPSTDDQSDEVLLAVRNLEAVGAKKYGVPRKTLAECILGGDVTLEPAPPPRRERPRRDDKPPEQRPARNIGQRKRRRAR